MILHPTPIETNNPLLTYVGSDRMFVTEVSDLNANSIEPGAVYDDACDVGFTLISHRTGRDIVVVQHHTETRDGDTLWWDYVPARELAAIVRGAAPTVTLRVFND